MNEQFDRALRNHIRDTFDHYDDLMADDGWKKFKKERNRKKSGLIFWYALPSGIAAALALFWLFNLSTTNLVKTENILLAEKQNKAFPQTNKSAEVPVSGSTQEHATSGSTSKIEREAFKGAQDKVGLPVKMEAEANPATALNRQYLATIDTKAKGLPIIKTETSLNATVPTQLDFIEPDILVRDKQEYLAFNNTLLDDTDLAVANRSNTNPDLKKETKKANGNLNFSLDANTFYSFTSGGLSSDLNLGVGFLSELKISKHFSVNSGIALNRQTTRYGGEKSVENSSNTLSLTASKRSAVVPNNVETSAKLVGFDIPINIKYNLPIGKAKTFITTGISSYSLLNQSYVNDFSVINYSLNKAPTTSVVREVEKENDGAFSNFQFARTLNFSFGVMYPVSGKNSISVEPFLKYPIAGFGSQDLEIGSGGISFKLNFGK